MEDLLYNYTRLVRLFEINGILITFCTMSLCCILCIHIRDICEHVKLEPTIQYNGVFSTQFCSNHNLAIPLSHYTSDVIVTPKGALMSNKEHILLICKQFSFGSS